MQLLQLVQSQVRLNEPLPWGVRDADTNLLLAKGYVLTDEDRLLTLLERGMFVDLEEFQAVEAAAGRSAAPPPPPPTLFERWDRLFDRQVQTLQGLDDLSDPAATLNTFTDDLLELIDRDADIAIYHLLRQERRQLFLYGYWHAIHTAILCRLMAEKLLWEPARQRVLVKAALTMNIASADLQGRLAVQEVPITERQRKQLHGHALLAAERLRGFGVADAEWLEAVENHHERADGSGYPRGLRDSSPLAQALRHADVFGAKITARANRPALSLQDAARQLFKEDQGGPFATALIRSLGIYPPGELVKLQSGELAVVVRRGADANKPLVACITDTLGQPVPSTVQRQTADTGYGIAGAVPDKSMVQKLPPERLYGMVN